MNKKGPARLRPAKKVSFDHRKLGMKIRDVMTREVISLPVTATALEAAQLMSTRDVGLLPVCDGARVVGVLTDRDLTVRAAATGRSLRVIKVREVMTPLVVYCYEDEDVSDAVASMEERQVRRVLVFNRRKQLTGVLSIGEPGAGHRRQTAGWRTLAAGLRTGAAAGLIEFSSRDASEWLPDSGR